MMRIIFAAAMASMAALASCTPPPQETEAPAAQTASFEDGGCLGYLLLQRTAIAEGRAQGDEAVLGTALEAWRAAADGSLSATELAQYEASSVAVQDDAGATTIESEAARCVAIAPQG